MESYRIPLPRWRGIGALQKVSCIVRQCYGYDLAFARVVPRGGTKQQKWAVLEPHSLRAPCRCRYGIRSSRVSGRRTGVIDRPNTYRLDIGPKKGAVAFGRRPLSWTMRQPRSVMGPGHGTTIKSAMANATIDVIFVRAPGGGRQLRPDKIQDRINRF